MYMMHHDEKKKFDKGHKNHSKSNKTSQHLHETYTHDVTAYQDSMHLVYKPESKHKGALYT